MGTNLMLMMWCESNKKTLKRFMSMKWKICIFIIREPTVDTTSWKGCDYESLKFYIDKVGKLLCLQCGKCVNLEQNSISSPLNGKIYLGTHHIIYVLDMEKA